MNTKKYLQECMSSLEDIIETPSFFSSEQKKRIAVAVLCAYADGGKETPPSRALFEVGDAYYREIIRTLKRQGEQLKGEARDHA